MWKLERTVATGWLAISEMCEQQLRRVEIIPESQLSSSRDGVDFVVGLEPARRGARKTDHSDEWIGRVAQQM
jgi:hypothetical protein